MNKFYLLFAFGVIVSGSIHASDQKKNTVKPGSVEGIMASMNEKKQPQYKATGSSLAPVESYQGASPATSTVSSNGWYESKVGASLEHAQRVARSKKSAQGISRKNS